MARYDATIFKGGQWVKNLSMDNLSSIGGKICNDTRVHQIIADRDEYMAIVYDYKKDKKFCLINFDYE